MLTTCSSTLFVPIVFLSHKKSKKHQVRKWKHCTRHKDKIFTAQFHLFNNKIDLFYCEYRNIWMFPVKTQVQSEQSNLIPSINFNLDAKTFDLMEISHWNNMNSKYHHQYIKYVKYPHTHGSFTSPKFEDQPLLHLNIFYSLWKHHSSITLDDEIIPLGYCWSSSTI